jgi:hypothetical protein
MQAYVKDSFTEWGHQSVEEKMGWDLFL